MEIVRKFFPENIPDNEEIYFQHLRGVLEAIDELSILQISKLKDRYHFRLSASLPMYNSMLLKQILKLHNLYNIKLDISKSIKTSSVITFQIGFAE